VIRKNKDEKKRGVRRTTAWWNVVGRVREGWTKTRDKDYLERVGGTSTRKRQTHKHKREGCRGMGMRVKKERMNRVGVRDGRERRERGR